MFLNSGVFGCNIKALQFKSENGNIDLALGLQEYHVDFDHLYRHGRQLQYTFDHLTCQVISCATFYKIACILRMLWLDEPHFRSEYRGTADVISFCIRIEAWMTSFHFVLE